MLALTVVLGLLLALVCGKPMELLLVDLCQENAPSDKVHYKFLVKEEEPVYLYIHKYNKVTFDMLMRSDGDSSVSACLDMESEEKLDNTYTNTGCLEGTMIQFNKAEEKIIPRNYIAYISIFKNGTGDADVSISFENIKYYNYDEEEITDGSTIKPLKKMRDRLELENTGDNRVQYSLLYIGKRMHYNDVVNSAILSLLPYTLYSLNFKETILELGVGSVYCQRIEDGGYDNLNTIGILYYYDDIMKNEKDDDNSIYNNIRLNAIENTDAIYLTLAIGENVSLDLDYILEPGFLDDNYKIAQHNESDNTITLKTTQNDLKYYEFNTGMKNLKLEIIDASITDKTTVIFYESNCNKKDSKSIDFDHSGVNFQDLADNLHNKNYDEDKIFYFKDVSSCQYVKFITYSSEEFTKEESITLKYSYQTSYSSVLKAFMIGFIIVVIIVVIIFFLIGKGVIRIHWGKETEDLNLEYAKGATKEQKSTNKKPSEKKLVGTGKNRASCSKNQKKRKVGIDNDDQDSFL